MTLASVMVATAIGAILVAVVAALYSTMAMMRVRAELTNEADSMANWLQDLLNNPTACATALRTSVSPNYGGNPVAWNVANAAAVPPTVGQIAFTNGVTRFVALYQGQVLEKGTAATSRLAVQSMKIVEPDPNKGEGQPARSQITQMVGGVPTNLNVVNTKLVLTFSSPTSLFAAGSIERKVDLTLAFNAASPYRLTQCFQSGSTTTYDVYCKTVTGGNQPCGTPNPGCEQWYYINGFDAVGKPKCACAILCTQPPVGPPGAYCLGKSCPGPSGGGGN
jgi:hypothetical protein